MDLSSLTDKMPSGVLLVLVLWIVWRQYRQDKTGTDAQTDATAIALLKEMREERSAERRDTREELGKVRERVALLEDRERRHADVLQHHAAWDARVVAVLHATDSSAAVAALGEPPPLYPQGG